MAWRKSSPALIAAFDGALPDDPRVERRSMFGYPAAFVNGNMFTGLHQENLMLRLPEKLRGELAKRGGAPWEPTPGRRMREYMLLPEALLSDRRALTGWLSKSLAYAASLAPKARRTAKPARAALLRQQRTSTAKRKVK